MSGFGRRFDPAELSDGIADAELVELARNLETFAATERATPRVGFEDRVMTAVALEAPPRVSLLRGGLWAVGANLRDAWRIVSSPARPAAVRAQAMGVVLAAALALGSVGGVTAVGAWLLLRETPTPMPSVDPQLPGPAPDGSVPPAVATTSPDASSPAPSASATDDPSPSPTPHATASGAPGPTSTPSREPEPTPRPTEDDDGPTPRPTALPDDTPGPTGTEDPDATDDPDGTEDPNDTPDPTRTPDPDATPDPDGTADLEATSSTTDEPDEE